MDIRSTGPISTPPVTTVPAIETDVSASTGRTASPVQTENAVRQVASPPTMQQVAEAVKNINKAMQAQGQGVEFSIDSESDQMVVKIVDQETKTVLRQIPSEEALQIAKALDRAQGLLIKQKA